MRMHTYIVINSPKYLKCEGHMKACIWRVNVKCTIALYVNHIRSKSNPFLCFLKGVEWFLHCPPATHLMPIHHIVNMVQWWYTCKKLIWLNFLRKMKNTVSRYSTPLEIKYHHRAAATCITTREEKQGFLYHCFTVTEEMIRQSRRPQSLHAWVQIWIPISAKGPEQLVITKLVLTHSSLHNK